MNCIFLGSKSNIRQGQLTIYALLLYALGWTCAQVLQNCRHQPRYCSAAVNHDRNFDALFDCLDVHCRASSVSRRGVGVRSRASRDTWHVTLGTRPHIPACLCHTHVTVTLSRGANTGNTAGLGHCTAWTQLNISYKKGTNDWFWLVIGQITLISLL